MIRHTVRATRLVLGIALVLVGVVLSLPFVPGPGLLFIFGGLTVLSSEFAWAQRLRDQLRGAARRVIGRAHGR